MASKRATSPITAACSGLIALLLLSLLCLVQADVTASATAASGGAGISAARQGDVAALLRITGKTHALEIRAGRPVPAKFVSGTPGALPPAAAFFLLDRLPAVQPAFASEFASQPRASANQPRAPPSA
jgi:hypothetical protein